MGKTARAYSIKTVKRLFALSGNECAFPGCHEKMTNEDGAINSNICHIEAANVDGERYNPNMSDSERADYPNLIILCPRHHQETNNVDLYTVDVLRELKRSHESEQLNKRMAKNPSMLNNAINAIASFDFSNSCDNSPRTAFSPESKIKFNELKVNVPLIYEYKAYHAKLNTLYDELDSAGSIKKDRLLHNILTTYLRIKGNYVGDDVEKELEIVKQNSDKIFDDVYNELQRRMEDSPYWEEDLIFSIHLIMVDAFIRCKILEEPR